MTDAQTRVMLVDDHSIMRDLLREALENTGQYLVVAQAADGEEALGLVSEAAPDVVVMDVIMPVMDGIEACRRITDLMPDVKVLMLTASNERDAIARSISAGATGYLQKYSDKEQLLTTLGQVVDGEFRIMGDVAKRLSRASRGLSNQANSQLMNLLTEREREILKLFADGLDLPGDRRRQGQQRSDDAERGVGDPEEAGFQDASADGGLGGAQRHGGGRSVLDAGRAARQSLPRCGRPAVGQPSRPQPCHQNPTDRHGITGMVVAGGYNGGRHPAARSVRP